MNIVRYEVWDVVMDSTGNEIGDEVAVGIWHKVQLAVSDKIWSDVRNVIWYKLYNQSRESAPRHVNGGSQII